MIDDWLLIDAHSQSNQSTTEITRLQPIGIRSVFFSFLEPRWENNVVRKRLDFNMAEQARDSVGGGGSEEALVYYNRLAPSSG